MEGVLDQGSKKLLFFVFEKFLLLIRSARPISQRIADRLVLKLERAQTEVKLITISSCIEQRQLLALLQMLKIA